ncbi:uncharacterized protein LOC142566176 [Dermacentor variabilis]|uniref:uncharacterized protein LOC142566176 n=1 Tax=Dermacentor variabilis TaxID=34621 RepID=UPI003F5C8DC8
MHSNEMQPDTELTGTTQQQDVSAVSIRLPPYWDRNPAVWFLQAESQFILSGVRTEQRKYHLVVWALSPTAAEEVADLLSGPASATPYSDLKAALLERTTTSQRARMQQLLSAEDLGDRRPSHLLRRMRQLMSGNTTVNDDRLLRELFMQRLPVNVQMILATATLMDLNSLASLADKVIEVVTPAVCNVTPSSITASSVPQTSSSAASPIDVLCNRLEQVVCAAERHRTSPRHGTYRSSSRSRRPREERSRSQTPSRVCFYHRRFGQEARHCLRPCAWQGNQPGDL